MRRLEPTLRTLLRRFPPTRGVAAVADLAGEHGLLRRLGWVRSRREGVPVDADGAALPWFTYASIAFLEGRVTRELAVFEYGCGYSTLWWAARVGRVASVESDPGWYQRMTERAPANASLVLAAAGPGGGFAEAIRDADGPFDVVVIDGADRVRCAHVAPEALAPGGVIVWDNSDRDEYREGYEHLRGLGFRRLDFHGLGPVNHYGWCTSVFYRPDSCLGI